MKKLLKATITWPIIKGGENISSIKKSSLKKQNLYCYQKMLKIELLAKLLMHGLNINHQKVYYSY